MNGFTWAWIGWLVVTIGSFGVLETLAVIRKNDSKQDPDTLSDHLVLWIKPTTRAGRIVWTAICVGLAVLVAWLYPHVLTEQAV